MLYHATWVSNLAGIAEKGLLPGIDGSVYLAGPQPGHAAQFLMFNTQFDGFHEVEVNGEKHTLPVPVKNTHIYVYSVDVDRLDGPVVTIQ